jgi:hypothetical protein
MEQSQLKLKKINLIIGVRVEKVQNNLFVMGHTKVQILRPWLTRLMGQKECSFVLAKKLTINHFVMDHIINKKR